MQRTDMAFSKSWPRSVVLSSSASWSPFMMTWMEQFCTMVPLPTPSSSLVAWNKAVSSPLLCLESFFATLPKHDFGESTEGIYLRTRSDGNLFKLSRLRAKTRVHEKYVRDLLFADDAAITTHTQEDLQWLLDRFQKLVDTLELPSAWQKHRSWGKTLRRYHCSSLTNTN